MPSVLAIAAHPDDIEFIMAGTMLQLAARGWELHYLNIAQGCRGSMTMGRDECAAVRLEEAKRGAAILGARFYPPLCPDFEIDYVPALLAKVAAVVRQAKPSILLTHAPVDYMEDHEQTCRLAVSAAFAHAMPNYECDPPEPIFTGPVTIYHAQPHGNRTPLGELVRPRWIVDTTGVMPQKIAALGAHVSQKSWLDQSQGMDSYIDTMRSLTAEVGEMSGCYRYGEGWRRREHWGFCGPDDDPLRTALADCSAPPRD